MFSLSFCQRDMVFLSHPTKMSCHRSSSCHQAPELVLLLVLASSTAWTSPCFFGNFGLYSYVYLGACLRSAKDRVASSDLAMSFKRKLTDYFYEYLRVKWTHVGLLHFQKIFVASFSFQCSYLGKPGLLSSKHGGG